VSSGLLCGARKYLFNVLHDVARASSAVNDSTQPIAKGDPSRSSDDDSPDVNTYAFLKHVR